MKKRFFFFLSQWALLLVGLFLPDNCLSFVVLHELKITIHRRPVCRRRQGSQRYPNPATVIRRTNQRHVDNFLLGLQQQQEQQLFYHEFEVDSSEINDILDEDTRLRIQGLISQRAVARWEGNYKLADSLKYQINSIALTDVNFKLILEDIPRSKGGGTTWKLVYQLKQQQPILHDGDKEKEEEPGILNLAHSALGMAVHYSEQHRTTVPDKELDQLVEQAKERLRKWDVVDSQVRIPTTLSPTTKLPGVVPQSRLSYHSLRTLLHHRNTTNPTLITTTITNNTQEEETETNLVEAWSSIGTELSGRKPADAAFWFTMAGSSDSELLHLLTKVCTKELQRYAVQPSTRIKDILAVSNRLAAAGVRQNEDYEGTVRQCIALKKAGESVGANQVSSPSSSTSSLLDLHSDHCAMMIWKFSTRQKKQRSFLNTAAGRYNTSKNINDNQLIYGEGQQDDVHTVLGRRSTQDSIPWETVYKDPTRPLVVDLGCGMGVSCLGLASLKDDSSVLAATTSKIREEGGTTTSSSGSNPNWSHCNFVGVDWSALTIGYARAITELWCIEDRLAFVVNSAENLLRDLRTYPGSIERIHIQFPTPYRLPSPTSDKTTASDDNKAGGNSQLPVSATDGFMVDLGLLKQACSLLQESTTRTGRRDSHHLLLQSNCEDVAVWMANLACDQAGFRAVNAECPVLIASQQGSVRTLNWIAMGGERAQGPGWSSVPLLPRKGWTETEVACMLNRTPVHRCLLTPKNV